MIEPASGDCDAMVSFQDTTDRGREPAAAARDADARTATSSRRAWLVRAGVLAAFVAVFAGLWASGATDALSFETLREHRATLKGFVTGHYALTVAVFVVLYCAGVAFSLPGAVWMSIAGGFLFGTFPAAFYIVIGATAGAVAIFLLARTVFREAWAGRMSGAMARMEAGFRRDAFSYLLVLRLVPLFPFWLVNLVPALLGVRLSTYTVATFLGIIPGALVYAGVGNGLDAVFEAGGRPDLGVIWNVEVLGPLVGLALLALVPVGYRAWKERRGEAPGGGDAS